MLQMIIIILYYFNVLNIYMRRVKKRIHYRNNKGVVAVGILCQMFITALFCWPVNSLSGVVGSSVPNLRAL